MDDEVVGLRGRRRSLRKTVLEDGVRGRLEDDKVP